MIGQCHDHAEQERGKASLSAASGECALSLPCIRTRATDLQRSALRRAPNNPQTLFLLQIRHKMWTFCVRSLRTPRTRLTKGSYTGHSNRFMFTFKDLSTVQKKLEVPERQKESRHWPCRQRWAGKWGTCGRPGCLHTHPVCRVSWWLKRTQSMGKDQVLTQKYHHPSKLALPNQSFLCEIVWTHWLTQRRSRQIWIFELRRRILTIFDASFHTYVPCVSRHHASESVQ